MFTELRDLPSDISRLLHGDRPSYKKIKKETVTAIRALQVSNDRSLPTSWVGPRIELIKETETFKGVTNFSLGTGLIYVSEFLPDSVKHIIAGAGFAAIGYGLLCLKDGKEARIAQSVAKDKEKINGKMFRDRRKLPTTRLHEFYKQRVRR